MTALAVSLPADASMARAASVMAKEGIHRAVVHNQSGHVIGMLTSLDVVRWVAEHKQLVSPDE
jgi:CBS domain-containing protein